MPTIQNSSRGQVVQIWGKAYIRGTDGVWRPLAVGETVPQGSEILTEQDAIVMMTRSETPLPKIAESPVERAIAAVESNEAPPAAGLLGGGSGDLQPGLRIDRIVELVTPASLASGLDAAAVEFGRATQSDPGASAIGAPRLIAASSSITSVEEGSSVNLGLRAPSGPGTLTITVTALPTIGQVFTAAGTLVVAGTVLTADELTTLTYTPPADYIAGTPVGNFGYSVSNGIDTANGGTRIAVTPLNDAPLAIAGNGSGAEDILLDVSLGGTDIDGTVASVSVATLPANGTLLLRDTLAPVAAGTVLTPAQAAALVFSPNANWNGSTSFTFTVTDNEGLVSAPATVQLQITPVNDPPLGVNDSSSTVAQAPVTVAVLDNDSDVDNDPLTVTSATVSAALGSVIVNGDGTLTFTAAPGVTGAVAISYTIADPSGATSTATLTVNVAAAPTVTVDAPELTNDTTPTLTGSSNLPPGSTVTLTVTGANGVVQTFTTTVRADGTYSVDVPAPLAEGPYTAVANVNGPGGTTATANDNGVVDITPPVITVDAPALTNDSTPPLTGTTDLPAGSTITLTVTGANSVSQLFSTTVQAGGVFSVDVPAALISGPFTVIASGTDAAGNTATATDNGVVDAVPPVITVDAPALTNDTTPALTGTTDLTAGSTITLTVTGANGAVQTFTTSVQAGGVYSVDVPAALVEGNFSVTASGTDAAGNAATASDNGVVDITPPTVTVDAPALTNDTTPPLTGTTNLPAGSTVTLTVTGANGAVQTFTATVQAGGTFSVDVPAALVQGNFNVTATATDAAGNSASASDTGLIDTTPPAATLAIDPITADNIVNAGEATGSITITGTVGGDVQVGDTVTLNVNGVNYTGLVLAGNTFAIDVPGAGVLADADRRIDGSITTTDAAGNSATATAQRPYAVNSAPIAVNDTLSIGEDTASAGSDVTPGTAAQDRDADGDTLTVIGVATGVQPFASGNVNSPLVGTWGTLLLDGFGAYTYAPSPAAQALDAGETVTDTFTYTTSDGRGGSATATLTISVVGANDPTTISGVFIGTVTEDAVATASGTLTNNDPDVGTRDFVAQSNSAGTYGLFSIDTTGAWTYTLTNAATNVQALAQGQSVTETFIVATDDGTTASITVTVSGANDAPVVSSTSINAVEEGAAVALGLAVPSDIDNGSVLVITVNGLPAIGQVQLADGTAIANGATLTATQLTGLRYLPPADYSGTPVGTFAYTVSDGITSVNGSTTINVAAVNDRPIAIDVAASGFEDTTTRIAVTPAGSDIDGSIVSWTLSSVPANGSLYSAATGGVPLAAGAVVTGPVYFQPNSNFNGTVSFNYTATDDGGAVSANTATATIVVSPVNDAPTLTGLVATYNYSEGGTPTVVRSVIDGSVVLADIDSPNFGGGAVTVSIANVVTAEDLLGVRNQGTGNGQISVSGTTVSYNPAGTDPLVAIGTLSGGSGGAPLVITFNANASVAAVDALLQNITYGNASQLPTTTPRNLTITIVDGDGTANGGADTVSTNVTVNITRVNDAPLFTALNGGVVNTTEGAAPALLDTNATVNDPELGSGYVGAINDMGGAVLTLARVGGANTQDQFSASGGTLALAGGNVVLGGNTVGTYDSTALTTGTLRITFASGTTQADATGVLRQIRYVNSSDAPPASVAIGYTINDGNTGSQGTGGARTGTATVTVNIAPVNDAPVAANDSDTTSENTPLAASVPAATDADGTIASYALVTGVGAGNGALTFNNDGTFTFNPGGDFDALPVGATRDVTFTYTATDNSGAVSNVATVTITVTGTNDGPVAFDATQTTGENSTLNASVPAGSDVDGTIASYALVGNVGAGNGNLTFNADGSYSFATGSDFDALAAGQSRDVTFTYTATDNDGLASAPATVTITVTGANDAPTGADATVTIAEDGSRAFAGADFGFSDIDVGDTLAAVRIDSLPAAGTLTLNGTPVTATQVIAAADLANLVFTPLADTSGAPYAAFTFSVQDNGGLFDSAPNTITFNVTPENDPPLAVVTPASGDEDTPIAVSLAGTDIDGTVTAVTVTALPGNGTLFFADGITPVAANTPMSPAQAASLVFRPAADFNGSVTLSFTVTDNSGAVSAPAVLPITVAAVVDPAITIDDVSVNEGAGTVTFTVTLDQPTTATVSVDFATGDGTASAGADYTAGSGTLTFAPGTTTRTVTVPIADDGTFEGSETFNVVLSGAINATIADAIGVATINDNDAPTIAVSSPTVAEGGFSVFTVSLSNPSTAPVTFNPSLASSSAAVGTDTSTALEYFDGSTWLSVPVGGVTIAAGSTSVLVRVATVDDVAAEGDETFALTATVTAGTTANASASGSATITDDTDATTVTLTATPSVAEGGSIVYTATLGSAAIAPMAVVLSSGQTINIAAGASSGALTIAAPGDDPYLDAGSVSRTIASTSGGGLEAVTIDPAAAVTSVSDTVDTTTVSITGDAVVAEGATAAYAVSLTSPAQTTVTVTLAYSGVAADGSDFTGVATVTIPAGTSSAALNIATLQDVLAEGAESFTVAIASASGSNFESLAISGANGAATTSISDDDTPTISVSSPTVGEGGLAVFTVSLSNPSTTAVTFNPTLASGTATVGTDTASALEYFDGATWLAVPVGGVTLAAGATSVQVRVATTDDFAAEGSETFALTATVTSANTGNAAATGTATITDDSDMTTVGLAATPSIAEGGSILYTATLSNATASAMTVTLSNGAVIAIAAGATTGTVSVAAPGDDPYLDAGSVSATIASTSGGGFEAVTIDPTAATTAITDTIDVTAATLTATPSVAEGGTITYTVSLAAPVTGSPVNVLLANGQTVTIAVGASSASVTSTVADNAYAGGGSVSNSIVSASGGNFEQLTPNTAPVTTTVTDDGDVTTVSLSATDSVVEGGSITYTATLTSAAQTTVNITLSNGAVIAIAAGATTGTAIVAAPGDDPYVDASTVNATISTATGGNFESLQIDPTAASTIVSDDLDATTVSLSATAAVAEGGSIVYTATLGNAAQSPVTVTLSSGQTITIAAGSTTGSVSILAPTDDVYVDAGSVSRTITSATGGNFEVLAVNTAAATTAISDTIDATTVSITGDAVVAEGATASYTVSLTSTAQTAVTVNLTYSGVAADGTDFTGAATVTIAAGSSSANFNIATLQDVLAEGAENFTVAIASVSGGNFENLVISGANGAATTSITDDDTPTLSVSSPTIGEGGFAVFIVSLSNLSTTSVTFNPTLTSGTATVGTDTSTALEYFDGAAWVAVPVGGVTLAAGSTSVQVRVATSDDVAAEGDEQFALTATVTAGTTANASAAGTATITDDIDAPTVALTATPSVAEGGSIVYTATLTSAALSPMTVTLSNGATITIAAGNTSGSTPVAAPSDDVYVDAGSISTTIASTSGGGFEAVTIDTTAATTAVSDTIDVTTATLTATPSVAEGGTITWTVSLTAPVTGSDVSVTLAGGQTITIPVGASSGTATGTAPDNVFGGGSSVSNNIAAISGGNFEQLTPNTAPVTTAVADDGDVTTVTLAASPSVVEGGSIVYTATLSNAAQTPVTVTLSNGATINIAAGDTSGSATVAAPGDDPYLDASTVSTTITTATGGNFESLQINPAAADTGVTDDVDPTTVSLSATASVAEGGSIVYTATVSNAAQTPVTVTLSTGETITIAAGATTGSVAILAPTDDVYVDGSSVSRTISSASGGSFESLVVNPAAAATTVTDTIDTTTVSITGDASVAEGASAAYTVSLTSAAQTAVTVNLSYAGTAADGSDFTGVATVTIAAGTSSTSLNIATLADVLAEGVENFTVTIASAAGGNFENLVISSANGAQTTAIIDDDTPALSVSSPSIGEGGFAVFTVSLSNPSTTAVTFNPTLSSGSATVGTDTSTALEYFDGAAWVAVPVGGVTIAAGSTNVQVRVATTDDVAAEGDETFALSATVTAGTTANASAAGTATINDDIDATTVTLTATPSIAEGGSIVYTATLSNAAVSPMTVTLSNGTVITIAAGATSGSTPVAAPTDDAYIDAGSVSATIATTSGGSFEAVTINPAAATTTVTDTTDTTTATLTASPSVAEGGTITYTVNLTAAVTGSDVSVMLANGQTVTIPVGASSASVTAVAPDNVYGGGASVANNIVSASGGNYEQLTPNTAPVSTTVTDDGDATTVTLSATPSVVEGTSITYTATLSNAAQTAVTVTLSNGATINIAAGATSGTATVAAPGDDVYVDASTVSATIATATGGNFENLQINPAAADTTVTDDSDPTTIDLSATPSVAEGGSIVYTATLSNAAQTPLVVTLSTEQTINIAAGATSGSVSILAPADDVFVDAGSVTRSITATSGGNFENLQVGASSATTAVTDTIDATTVSITGSATVSEGATASYTVSLTSPAQTAVTVNLTYAGTAADGSDYTGVASVVIPAGASSASFNVATLQDVIGEGAESFTVSIAGAAGGNFESLVISGTNGAQTTSISDDDTPTIAVSSPSVGEGGFAVFNVSLSNASASAVTFNPTLASGTATVGTDTSAALEYFDGANWLAVPVGGVTIAAGSTSVQVRVATTDDAAGEGNETFTLTATVTAGLTGNSSATGTATITDDIDPTTLTLSATPSVAEGGSIVYTATLSNAAVTPMAVTLSTGQTINIAAGATSGGVSIAAPGEDPYVDASTVSRTISSTSGGGFEALTVNPAAAMTAVTDTIDTTTLSISGSASVVEGASGSYTVSLTSPAQTAVTVNLTYSGTATNGTDFTGVATVTIAAGASSATFNIATIDDLIDEVAAESFTVSIASAGGGNFENLVVSGANNSVTTVITDNDAAPTIAVSSPTAAEAGGFAQFTVTLSNPSSTATTVSLALANGTAGGADYSPALEISTDGGATWNAATSATFAAGATSVLVRTPIVNDALDEADETFTLTATRTAGTTSNASAIGTATITDDDATPSLSIDDVTVNETAGTATFTVTLSAASGQNVSVDIATANVSATAGADYTAVPTTTLTFAPGVTTQTVTVPILDDGTYEGIETFNVLLSGAVNASIADGSGLGTINDNDLPALSVSSPTVGEGGFAVFTVALSNPSTTAVTFNPTLASGSATVGTDTGTALEYFNGTAWVAVPVGGVVIAAGSTSVQVRVATTDDVAAEGNETFALTATVTAGTTSNASASGTATITDDSDTTTVTLAATPSVVEGSSITYTATLSNAAVTPMTVTLSTGQAINIGAGATSGSVSIAAPSDDPYIDAGTLSRTIATTSGGGFEALTIDTTAALTSVTDDSDATTVTLSATPSVAEGGSIVYTATLTNAAQSPVTVTLSSGQTISIAAGATTGTVSILAPADDVYVDAGSVSRTIASASGGNFESLVVNPAAATTAVSDTIDTTTATLTATPSVAEGGTITYTVSLTAPVTGSAVTVTLAGGQTISIPVGASSGTATATAPDNVYSGGGSVANNIASISGGNFEQLTPNTAPVTTAVTDDADLTTVTLTATPSVVEGGNITYTATLTNAALTPVTVNLAGGGVITIAAGATTGTLTLAAPSDDVYIDASTVSRTIGTATGGGFELLAVNPAAANTNVTDDSDATTLTLTATPSVVEGGNITYTATLSNAAQTAVTVTLSTGQTINIAAGATTGTVIIAAPSDDVYIDASTVSRTISTATGGNFELLTINPAAASTTVTDDSDATTVSLTATPSVVEGGTITYTATLTNAAQTAVTVTLSTGQTINIAAGATSGTVDIAAPTDDVYVDASTVSRTISSATGGNFELLTVNPAAASTTVTDDSDATTVTLTATPSVAEGGSIVYTATLTNAAQTAVTVTLSTGQTINIAAGATTGTVSIAAPTEDVYVDGSTVSRTIASASGGNFESLTVNPAAASTTVTDTIDTTTLSITGSATVAEGASGSYTVSLTSPAQTTAVTVNLSYSGTAANGVDFTGVATVTIPVGSSSATFNIATIDDLIDEVAAESFTVTVASASGGNFENLVVSGSNNSVTTAITDNDAAPTISVSSPTVAEAGGFAQFTVSLSNPSSTATTVSLALANLTATGGGTDYGSATATNLQVSTDGGATWANATSATFAAGATSLLVRTPITNDVLDEADETFNLTATRTAGTTSNASAVGTATITDDDATPSLSIGNVSVNESAGTMTFTVTLSAASGRSVTVNYGTSNVSAAAGSDYTANSGSLTFAAGVTTQIITVTIAEDALNEASETLNVTLTGASNATISGTGIGVGTIVDNDTPPAGRDATLTTLEDTAIVFGLSNFLMNDAEQGNNVNPSAVRIDALPANGSLFLNGALVTAGQVVSAANISAGLLTFAPASNANGSNYANFSFSVRDASGQYDLAPNTITVNVTAVSDGAPDARNDLFQTTFGTPITLTAAQLLANDTLPDGATITAIGAASGGTLVNNGNGTYTWTPTSAGTGTFTYTLTDQDGQTDTATVRIVANAAADDLASVQESALAGGTGAGTVTASGNLFVNDSGNTSISTVTFNGTTVSDGGAGDVDSRTGYIGVNSTLGRVVVDTTGTGAGDYTYTLLRNADNSAAADDTSVTESFSYNANNTDATLRVSIADDAPAAISRTVEVSEDQVPSYRLVLVLDVSGSMDTTTAGGAVRQVNDDGSVTITTRLDLARQALAQLVEEYYNQAQNVSITLVTFSDVASVVNPGAPYTTKDAAVAAILAADGSGGTNYTNALTAAQSAFGTVDPNVRNAIYFLSDGAPSGGDLTTPATSTGYANFVNSNGIDSYAVGVGTGIATTGPLNGIHNVDANGDGTNDGAIIVPDLNDLGAALLSTVPIAYGGNVVSSSADGNVLGADGGYIQTVTVRLDTNGDGTPDTDITFTHDPVGNTISRSGAFPAGFPVSGDMLTLNASRGFGLGTLTFNFSTGDYTYFTGGTATEGDSFTFSFVARDGDGDVTPASSLTVEIADGQPVARPDTDTLLANQPRLEGNVITGLGTDAGMALGGQLTNFSANGAGVDDAIDGAQVSSVAFKGVNYALTTDASGSGAGFTWNVTGGKLTWTATSGGEQLVFAETGYYQYTPPTAALPTVLTAAAVTTSFNSVGNADDNGVVLSGLSRTGAASSLTHSNPTGNTQDGVGVTGNTNEAVDNLETLVVNFSQATHPRGVQGVSFVVSADASNLGDNGAGTIRSLTYTVFDVAGNELGQFYSFAEGTVTMPSQYSNIGRIEIEANSAADARITSVSFSSINLNAAAAEVAPVEVGYTLTDSDGDSSSSTLTLRTMSNNLFGDSAANAITGTNGNDRIDGGAGNDTLGGGAGNDLLIGGDGADVLSGNDGIDELRGGTGNDTLNGGNGNNILVGGQGSDSLTGGAGADVFRWELADRGTAGTPATDTIANFNTAQGDQLDLRDLLQGETLDGGTIGNLSNYLFVERTGSNTTVHISSNGGFTSGYNAGAEDQTIVLTGVDLTSASTLTSQQVIQDLLNNNRLAVDP